MPLEIILRAAVEIQTREGVRTIEVLADFGPLAITASCGTPKSKYDPVEFPFTITHRSSGLAVNCFPSLDLASCAARQWSAWDWDLSNTQDPTLADREKRRVLDEQMRATAIYNFSGRRKTA